MPRPIVIVIEGCVGAGKTTLFRRLKNFYSEKYICFLEEPYFDKVLLMGKYYNPLEEIYQNPELSDNYVCSQHHITKTLGDYYTNGWKNAPITILDRWILSCEYFIRLRGKEKFITTYSEDYLLNDVMEKHQAFLNLLKNAKIYKFLLTTPPEQCSLNILQRGRSEEINKSQKYWDKFNRDFMEVVKKYGPEFDYEGNSDDLEIAISLLCETVLRNK